jgi:type IV secretory pathway TraG/TraD family ATPase VirD4
MQNHLRNIVLFCLCAIPFLAWYVADGRLFDIPVDMGSSGLFFPFISGKNFGFRVLVEIAFVAWAFLAIRYPEYRPRVSKLLLAYSSFIAVLFLADLFGIDPAKSFFSNYFEMNSSY